jgi:hypothetical protein
LSKLKGSGKYNQAILKNDNDIFKRKKRFPLEFQEEKTNKTRSRIYNKREMLIIWRMISIAKKLLENTIKIRNIWFRQIHFGTKIGRTKKYGCANVEFGGNGKTRSIAIVSNKYNEERSETIKDNDGKVIAKSTNNSLLELENNICWTKKSFKKLSVKPKSKPTKGEKIMTLTL